MKVYNLTVSQLAKAAESVKADLVNVRTNHSKKYGNVVEFTIKPKFTRDATKQLHPFIRVNEYFDGKKRIVNAICPHGHGLFMKMAFQLGATKIKSCNAKYNSLEELQEVLAYKDSKSTLLKMENNAPCNCDAQ